MGVFAVFGERWGTRTDRWWPVGGATAGGVLALTGPYFGQMSESSAIQRGGLLVGIVGVLLAAVLPIVDRYRSEAELSRAHDETLRARESAGAIELEALAAARGDFLFLVEWTLTPLAEKLASVLAVRKASRRAEAEYAEFRQLALSVAKEVMGGDAKRVRANYFALGWTPNNEPLLSAAGTTSKAPRERFNTQSVEGQAVLDMLASNGHRFCVDVVESPPPGWDSTQPRDYRTFISVTVQAGNQEPVGMLTVDAGQPGDLAESDVAVLRLIAVMLAIAESQRTGSTR